MNKSNGFTFIEMITVIAIAGIVSAMAVPSLKSMNNNTRAAAISNELVSALLLTRNEAAKRGTTVSICALSTTKPNTCSTKTEQANWSNGWMMFVDGNGQIGKMDAGDTALRTFAGVDHDFMLHAAGHYVTYQYSGRLGSERLDWSLRTAQCSNAATSNRDLSLSASGRVSVTKTTAAC